MALIYNNLLINKNATKFKPFLFNLVSGRRRLLNNEEFSTVCSMLQKQTDTLFDEQEKELFHIMKDEKQFLTDEDRFEFEQKLIEAGHFDISDEQADNYRFSIELTQNCNMSCSYCMVSSRTESGLQMTKSHIDAIYNFYHKYADDKDKIAKTSHIRVTGGEPLLGEESVELINYIVAKWPESKLVLFTNGVNIIKYYDKLPLGAFEEVNISLDGTKEVHMQRRYSNCKVDLTIYDNIIAGVKRLLEDGVTVRLKTTLDKSTYTQYSEFKDLLEQENISTSKNCEHECSIVNDLTNPLDLDENFNTKADVIKINEYLMEKNLGKSVSIPSSAKLYSALGRPLNERSLPKHQRCRSNFLANYYFSCDGNVYFCDCIYEGSGKVGTYYPNISIEEETVSKLKNRSVINNDKCRACAYKFVCLGGCPVSATGKGEEMSCGVFTDEDFLDNLEFNLNSIPR